MRVWEAALCHHPDRDLAEYSMQVIQQGSWVGIHEVQASLLSAWNKPSAYEQPQVRDKYVPAGQMGTGQAARTLDTPSSSKPSDQSLWGDLKQAQPSKC